MMATMNDNPWSSYPKDDLHLYPKGDSHHPHDDKPMISLAFPSQKDYGLWNSSPCPPVVSIGSPPDEEQSWGKPAANTTVVEEEPIPDLVMYAMDWLDDVSVLNDNPEEDDIEVLYLPKSTYDVLLPLFDELFMGDEEEAKMEESDDDDDDEDEDGWASRS
eukprot:scaffold3001_cov122-Cylindrotheca_fusiformis.AAC.8